MRRHSAHSSRPFWLLAGAGLLLLGRFGPMGHAAPPPPAPSTASPQTVSYEFGAAQWLNAPRTIEMSQGVTFGQDDAILKTNSAVALLDKEQHLLSAQAGGPVHIYDPQDDLTGQQGKIDFTRHLATLETNITLVVKPGRREANAAAGSPRRQFKDPATLTCQAMTWDYRHKIGRIPGALKVVQVIQDKDGPITRTLVADAGLYNGKAQTIQLVGDIHGEYSDGSKIVADTRPSGKPVVIGTKEGSEYLRIPFNFKGIFATKQDNSSGASDTAPDNTEDADLSVPPAPPKDAPPSFPAASSAPPTAAAP